MPQIDRQRDLEEAAAEEMERAVEMGWGQLSVHVPWGDTYEGYTPAGRDVAFERNYLWEGEEGGDIRVEVVVYRPEDYEKGVHVTQILPKAPS